MQRGMDDFERPACAWVGISRVERSFPVLGNSAVFLLS